jgi:hypothetical protein
LDRHFEDLRKAEEVTMIRAICSLMCIFALVGCSSIIEGTTQEVALNTNPAGADCGFYREGLRIAEVANTPGSALIKKTKRDITVICVKDGYQQATYLNHSGSAGATWGNVIAGGLIGWGVDSATGADNKYDGVVNLTLVPTQAAPAAPTKPVLPATLPGAPTS